MAKKSNTVIKESLKSWERAENWIAVTGIVSIVGYYCLVMWNEVRKLLEIGR